MHITLYRKYRPKKFDEVSGEKEIVSSLLNSLKNQNTTHAYLFSGPRGVGKTTIARLIAKGVNCLSLKENGEPCDCCENCKAINSFNFPDLIEIDAASNRSIDEIRNLKEKINYQPVFGKKKVYIIDEAHMLTKEAFNALLKTLEEPPSHVIFILATTELDKILPTIVSRCQRYDFKSLSLQEVKNRLEFILKNEKFTADEEVYDLIYENSYGSMRDAISVLERLIINENSSHLNFDNAQRILGKTSVEKLNHFLNTILENDINSLNILLEKLWLESTDIELFFKDLAKFCKLQMSKNKLDLNMGFSIISIIYDVLSKFKFEDDKRLVGYVLIHDLLMRDNNHKEIRDNFIKFKEYEKNSKKEIENIVISDISIDYIKEKWNDLINKVCEMRTVFKLYLLYAKPYKIENNNLFILFSKEGALASQLFFEGEYKDIFIDVAREYFKIDNLQLTCELEKEKKEDKDRFAEKFNEKVFNFFNE